MTKTKLWHIILLLGGALAVLSPDLTGLAAWLTGLGVGWLKWPARAIGIAALVGSRWDIIRAKLAPVLDGEELRRRVTPPPAALVLLAGLLLLGSCSSTQSRPTPEEVGRAIVHCAKTVCSGNPYQNPCVELSAQVLRCLGPAIAGAPAVCLAAVPAALQVGFADVVCMVDRFPCADVPPEIARAAEAWLKEQRVTVLR